MKWTIFMVLLCLTIEIRAKNVLFISSVPSASHHIWNKAITTGLADRGYNVTMLSPEIEYSSPNIHFLFLEGIYEKISTDFFDDYQIENPKSVFRCIKDWYRFSHFLTSELVKTNGFKTLHNYPNEFVFDAVIYDFTMGQSLLGFWVKFGKPPLISVSPFGVPIHTFAASSTPHFPGFMAHPLSRKATNLVVSDRVYNTLYQFYDFLYRKFTFLRQENIFAKRTFGQDLKNVEDLEKESQIFLVNSDNALDDALLLPPNVIPVGGLHINKKYEINPSVLSFLESSKNGVVLFSFGATVKPDLMTRKRDEILLDTFSRLDQYDFIWKYDKTEKRDCPKNILMIDWMDQDSILSHPKVKLFITSGGILSVQESVWNGVPMLVVPIWPQQYNTANKVAMKGFGKSLNIRAFSPERLIKLINEVIGNPGFKANVTKASQILKNQPEMPLGKALSWIEYAIDVNDLSSLTSPYASVPFYAMFSVDIVLVVLTIVFGYIFIIFRHLIFNKRKQPEQLAICEKKDN